MSFLGNPVMALFLSLAIGQFGVRVSPDLKDTALAGGRTSAKVVPFWSTFADSCENDISPITNDEILVTVFRGRAAPY